MSNKSKIFFVSLLSVCVILGTLVGAAVLSERINSGSEEAFPQTEYSAVSNNSSQQTVSSSSSSQTFESSSQEQEAESSYTQVSVGAYNSANDRILIKSCEHGFVEGSILCGGVTMDFSGQMVGNSLTATGTDNFNNTIEITLVFEENKINASSKPLIRYEEAADFLELNGTFIK